jgi:hypothetical protein
MTFGINRVHGSLIAPKNFAGVSLQDFTLVFASGDTAAVIADYNSGNGTPNGAFDQVFRTALETVGTVSRVGTLNTSTGSCTLNFALEVLGADQFSPGFLGMGPSDGAPGATSTAAAFQAAVNALGTTASVTLSSVVVNAFTY